ncbi:MAG TPA: hypothetical protein VFA48_12670 [Gammaproteobacteria bacterium]|nr:hypothetical protein [Gammaproteobacteria bacterium]
MQDVAEGPDQSITNPLSRTRPWMKFIAVMGFIGCGLMMLEFLFVLFGLPASMFAGKDLPHGVIFLMLLFYLASAIFAYLIPSILLMRAAGALDGIERKGTLETLAEAAERQRKFWKYYGVLVIVGICLFLLFVVGAAIMLPILAAAHLH